MSLKRQKAFQNPGATANGRAHAADRCCTENITIITAGVDATYIRIQLP